MEHNESGGIPTLIPSGAGHAFVWYGDSCSGQPDHPNTANFAAVNAVFRRLATLPDHVIFAGDAIMGGEVDAGHTAASGGTGSTTKWPGFTRSGSRSTRDRATTTPPARWRRRSTGRPSRWFRQTGRPARRVFPPGSGATTSCWSSSTPTSPASAAWDTSSTPG